MPPPVIVGLEQSLGRCDSMIDHRIGSCITIVYIYKQVSGGPPFLGCIPNNVHNISITASSRERRISSSYWHRICMRMSERGMFLSSTRGVGVTRRCSAEGCVVWPKLPCELDSKKKSDYAAIVHPVVLNRTVSVFHYQF